MITVTKSANTSAPKSPASISRRRSTSDTFAQVAKAFFDNEVVFFRNQKLTPAQQVAFTRRFGVLEQHVRKESRLEGHPEILIVSNVLDEKGNAIGSQDAGRFWHSDLSYKKEPSMLSALYAIEVPVKDGRVLGDTSFASTTAAYDALPEDLKQRVERPEERPQLSLLPREEHARRRRKSRRAAERVDPGARADRRAAEERAGRRDADRAHASGDRAARACSSTRRTRRTSRRHVRRKNPTSCSRSSTAHHQARVRLHAPLAAPATSSCGTTRPSSTRRRSITTCRCGGSCTARRCAEPRGLMADRCRTSVSRRARGSSPSGSTCRRSAKTSSTTGTTSSTRQVVALPGFVRARRYSVDDAPLKYLAWYETVDEKVEAGARFPAPRREPDAVVAAHAHALRREARAHELQADARRRARAPRTDTPWLYIVHTDIPDDIVDEYNDVVRQGAPAAARDGARRASARGATRRSSGNPRYLTAYELTDPDAFESPEGLQARKTPWTAKMRSLFHNTRRRMCRLVLPSITHEQAVAQR